MPSRNGSSAPDLWNWQDVTLSDGTTVRVRPVVPWLQNAATAKIPLPQPPIREIKSQMPGGGVERREDPNDPAYRQELMEASTKRMDAATDASYAWCIDCSVPEDESWREEITAVVGSDIAWSAGLQGKKVDYIKYVLIKTAEDFTKLQRVMAGLPEVTAEEVAAVEDSFRD